MTDKPNTEHNPAHAANWLGALVLVITIIAAIVGTVFDADNSWRVALGFMWGINAGSILCGFTAVIVSRSWQDEIVKRGAGEFAVDPNNPRRRIFRWKR